MTLINTIDNQTRISLLKKKIKEQGFVRIMEAHNGLSALIASDAKAELVNGTAVEFDGFWESSLTDSASRGLPDIEIVGIDSRLDIIRQILEVTKKPMIVDGDTGGDFNQFEYSVKKLERAGVSMVIIEDKVFPKRNSLESGTRQDLEKTEVFCEKIRRGIKIKTNPDFMVVARLESLIAGYGLEDALERAEAYLKAGVDGLMIHSKSDDPAEILEFAKRFKEFPEYLNRNKVLVCVPTTYNNITCQELADAGFNVIIHANHQLRAAYKAMENVCQKILTSDRSFEVNEDCSTVKEIFKKVGFLDVKEKDKEVADKLKSKIKVIIPAAGVNELAKKYERPVCLLEINGKTILERQLETLAKAGLDNITVIKGYQEHLFDFENIKYYFNEKYDEYHIMHSLLTAEPELNSPFIYMNSDILFSENIISSLVELEKFENCDIVLVVDDSYQQHKNRITKNLDLVRTNRSVVTDPVRKLKDNLEEEIVQIGKKLDPDLVHYEFIGIAYFSEKGAKLLKDTYYQLMETGQSVHEVKHVLLAGFTDLIQHLIDQGQKVKALKTYKGWMEIHDEEDLEELKNLS